MGLSIPHLLVVLAIVVLLFGTKRLRTLGSDLGDAIKGFRKAVKEGEEGNQEVNALGVATEKNKAKPQPTT